MTNFKGKTILITGGTGSFGEFFLDYLQGRDFKEIRVFSRDEMKQEQMRQRLNNSKIKFYIGDIRDRSSLDNAIIGANYIFLDGFEIQSLGATYMRLVEIKDTTNEHREDSLRFFIYKKQISRSKN